MVYAIIILAVIFFISNIRLNNKVDNYDIRKINVSKMNLDKIHNNLSNKQVQRNMINGKYDFKPGEYDIYTGKRY